MSLIIGYARVSTTDQNLQLQVDALKAAGSTRIIEEKASGGAKGRPELLKMLLGLRPGDTVVVWKLDRAARSLPHLLDIIERIRAAGASFRCIAPPIDTASPTGTLTLQILGAVAEFERSLIVERTRAGLVAARRKGRVGGNPRLKAGDAVAIALSQRRRRERFVDDVRARMEDWRSIVVKLRPSVGWDMVLRRINEKLSPNRHFSKRALLRHVRVAVAENLIDGEVLKRASSQDGAVKIQRHPAYSAILVALRRPKQPTLREIALDLEAAGIKTARGLRAWPLSSVNDLVTKVRATMK